jgi:hypothetical protein
MLGLRDWREVPDAWFDPTLEPPPTYLNEAARLSSRVRDEHMVRLLVAEVKRGQRVLAVVGRTHAFEQEPALRVGLGTIPEGR